MTYRHYYRYRKRVKRRSQKKVQKSTPHHRSRLKINSKNLKYHLPRRKYLTLTLRLKTLKLERNGLKGLLRIVLSYLKSLRLVSRPVKKQSNVKNTDIRNIEK